jgi:hypothetical protein
MWILPVRFGVKGEESGVEEPERDDTEAKLLGENTRPVSEQLDGLLLADLVRKPESESLMPRSLFCLGVSSTGDADIEGARYCSRSTTLLILNITNKPHSPYQMKSSPILM